MELLTRNNFEDWMQKLMERLDRQDELLLAMKAEPNAIIAIISTTNNINIILFSFFFI